MSISREFIDRYQSEYDKNPSSRLFAPLAEAYRKMGQLEEAQNLCRKGVQIHANFASGRLAYGKILIDLGQLEEAYTQLKKATELSPDNVLAFHLLGEVCLKLRRPREALQAFKMLLFLHPEDERAQRAVKKWEFLGAQDFHEDVFEKPVAAEGLSLQIVPEVAPRRTPQKDLDHALSLADALTVRNDLERALEVLIDAQMRLGQVPEIENRLQILRRRTQAYRAPQLTETTSSFGAPPRPIQKRRKLETLLRRINQKILRPT